MKIRVLHVLAVFTGLLVAQPALARIKSLDNFYVFGDSLSDNGNGGIITKNLTGTLFPPPPYADGRSSNGPIAAEYLWNAFHPDGSGGFRPSLAGGTNFAISGASTGLENFNTISPGVPVPFQAAYKQLGNAWQLDQFNNLSPSFDPDRSLFMVWLFPNDVLYTLRKGETTGTFLGAPGSGPPVDPATLISNGIQNIAGSITALASRGATQFLVPNMPDLGSTPLFLGKPEAPTLSFITAAFNDNLDSVLQKLDTDLPGVEIVRFQTDDIFREVLNSPSAYGFDNVKQSCLANRASCVPDRWFFWDDFHPTTAAHRVIAQSFYREVSTPVPGPLALLGTTGAFAWSRRLRRRIIEARRAFKP